MLAVGLIGIAAAVAVASARAGSQSAVTVVTATVTKPAPCSAPQARDGVEFQLGGKAQQATLDGCGHLQGVQLAVEVPAGAATAPSGPVREASTAKGASGFSDRLSSFVVVLAALAGGCYTLLLGGWLADRPRRAQASGDRRV